MKVEAVLKEKGKQVYTVHVEAIVADALRILNEKKIGALIVIDDDQKIRGIITERDIMWRCYECQTNVKGVAVKEIMTPREKLVVSSPEDDLEYVMDVMTDKRIRHVPIVDHSGCLAGLISVGDVIKALLTHKDYEIKYLKDYIEGRYPA